MQFLQTADKTTAMDLSDIHLQKSMRDTGENYAWHFWNVADMP